MSGKGDQGVVLSVENMSKSFGGIQALKEVNFNLKEGKLHALIGPNGAGKTTFFNLVTGELEPDEGEIRLFGSNITNLSPPERVKAGLGRTYQTTKIFRERTVEENLFLAVIRGEGGIRFASNSWLSEGSKLEQVHKLSRDLELEEQIYKPAKELSHGAQRKLELGLALGVDPKILLLDEPLAGLPTGERSQIVDVITDFIPDLSVILIEHDLDIVLDIVHKLTVLHKGEVIARGTPDEISSNERVQSIYTKEEYE